jgi:hypothetical protein
MDPAAPVHPVPLPKRLQAFTTRNAAELAACGFAVGWFYYLGYGPSLAPTNIAWMYRDDWSAYLWGFAFFRNSHWAWPLGNTPELFFPYGTSVGFTDANPWAAVLFKLFNPLVPRDFQFSGMWFLLCFVLQAFFGTRISAAFTGDKVLSALGGCLFALTPLLPSRHQHIALSAFFFVTAGVYLHLKPVASTRDARQLLRVGMALVLWVAGTHGYLSVMLLALAMLLPARLWTAGLMPRASTLAWTAAYPVATVAVYYLFGLIGWKDADLTAEGFGQFSGDLTTFFNPQGWSRWVPTLPHKPRQWEGFSYLGLGVFGLLAVRVLMSALAPRSSLRALRSSWPLLLALFGMWFYSLSSSVAYKGDEVWNLSEYYAHLGKLTGIFRSSGRFSWPLHMTLIALGVSAVAAIRQRWLGRLLLLGAVMVQAAELVPDRLSFRDIPMVELRHPAWSRAREHYLHISTLPLHLQWICRFDMHLVNRLSYEAYRRKLTFNSGNIMRKEPGVQSLCERHLGTETPIDAQTIYVVDPAYLSDFRGKNVVCGQLDGLNVCVSQANPSPLLDALRQSRIR